MAKPTVYKVAMVVTKTSSAYGANYSVECEVSGYKGTGESSGGGVGFAMERAYEDAVAKLVEAVTNG